METKICKQCEQEKTVDMFSLRHGKPRSACKTCDSIYKKANREKIRVQSRLYEIENPWAKTLKGISGRCTWKGNAYYKKGIGYKITTAELKELWFRDKAYEMKRPSIDRIDVDKGYSKDNCRYIELGINIFRGIKLKDKWAYRYEKCVDCGTTESKHVGNGRCSECYGAYSWKTQRK